MIDINVEAPYTSIVPFVRTWFALLAYGQLDKALESLDEPNSYGLVWSAETIEATVRAALGNSERESGPPKFSDPNELADPQVDGPEKFDDGSGYWFDHPVPLDGKWSDLTAQFEFKKRSNGFAVILHDLHVL